MQPKAGKTEIDRQRLVDFGAAIVEQVGGIGNWRGKAIADRVDRDRLFEQMAEMKGLQPVWPAVLAQQRLVRPETDIAPGIEIQGVERLGQGRGQPGKRRCGNVAGPLDHIVIAKTGRGGLGLGGGHDQGTAGGGKAGHKAAAGRSRHENPGQVLAAA